MMNNKLPRWKKRLQVFNLIYEDVLENHNTNSQEIIKNAFEKLEFDHFQMKIIEHYFANYEKTVELIKSYLLPTWPYERISPVTRAILLTAYSEYYSVNTDKPVIINEALKTCVTRGVVRDKKFINALLDKILISTSDKQKENDAKNE